MRRAPPPPEVPGPADVGQTGSAPAGAVGTCGCTPAQIALRWDLQRGFAVIPKSTQCGHIFENAAILYHPLEEGDLALPDGLPTGWRTSAKGPAAFDFDLFLL